MSPMKLILFVLLLTSAASGLALAGEITPIFDLRVRQEVLDGVYHFSPDADRNWIRVRTRAGVDASSGEHRFILRLNNEHRHFLDPDRKLDWDEVIIDKVSYRWQKGPTTATFGRQDIIWPGGFLMLEGHPLDGSRSMYHNAIRVQSRRAWGDLDFALIHNFKYDDLVLIDDQNRVLSDSDESGLALRLVRQGGHLAFIFKENLDTVFRTYTLDLGLDRQLCPTRRLKAELALQLQDGPKDFWASGDGILVHQDNQGWALALQAFLNGPLGSLADGEAGFFYYSGRDDGLLPFRTPWGRWPKWSDLYIYTLIGESTPGRVHVAAWENIAAPRLVITRSLGDGLSGKLGASYLLAPAPDWQARGLLTQAGVTFSGGSSGFSAHLLWEMLDPGAFHDGRDGLPPLTDTIHFLRWQLNWSY